jgi:molybdopterin-guanine dinucleotide biosynthesis protein A
MIPASAITGIMLCGGKALRMDGVEKALQAAGGAPLVGHLRDRLAPQVGAILISANREATAYAAWGDAVVPDAVPDLGPLGGLLSVLDVVESPWAFCCPGDAPLLDRSLVGRLAEVLERDNASMAMPHDGERPQPLFLLMQTAMRDPLRQYLADGGRSVLGFTERVGTAVMPASDIRASFLNVNTRDAHARVADLLRREGAPA